MSSEYRDGKVEIEDGHEEEGDKDDKQEDCAQQQDFLDDGMDVLVMIKMGTMAMIRMNE